MSIRAMAWAWEQRPLSTIDRLVLLALADHADDDGICWPGEKHLLRKTEVSRASLYRAYADLEQTGLLERRQDDKHETGVKHLCLGGVSERDGGGVTVTRGGSQPATRSNKEPSVKPSAEPSSEKSSSPFSHLLADLIAENGSKRPRITAGWKVAEERMLRIDGRDPLEAEALIRWCQADEFWQAVILSMPKFREQYDALRLRAKPVVAKAAPQSGRNIRAERAQRLQEHDEAEAARRAAEEAVK